MNKAIVVTGASSGLGLALTKTFLVNGERVVAVCRKLSQALEGLSLDVNFKERISIYEQDLTESSRVARLFHDIEATTPCRALVNNAACAHDGLAAFVSPAEMEDMLRVNLLAPMLLCRAAAMHMARRRGGAIVNITSASAHRAMPGLSVYGATKAGLDQFSKTLAREFGPRGVRVNCVAPGFLDTKMTADLNDMQRARISRRTPLPGATKLDDVCAVIVFLLSDAALQITGQSILVDGGFTL